MSPVSCWLCFSEPVASWLPASPPRPVSLAKTVGNGVSKLYPQPSIPEPSARSRRNISRLWEARAMAPMCACGLVAGHAAQPALGPQVGPRIPGSLSCGWKLGFLKPPPAGGFLPDPLVHPPPPCPRDIPGIPVCLYQSTCSPSSPSLSFPAAPLAFIPLHSGRPAGCPCPSSPHLPQPLVNSFGSWAVGFTTWLQAGGRVEGGKERVGGGPV